MIDPITTFQNWYKEASQKTIASIPSACCISTIGLDGYPNARFVSMKAVVERKFVITGPLSSRKAQELAHVDKAALTFWWPESERQVRIQGDTSLISKALAEQYFAARNFDSQVVSHISQQGIEMQDYDYLNDLFEAEKTKYADKKMPHPEHWGGFFIQAKRIEFMEFEKSRLHRRTLFTHENEAWQKVLLQP
ncbi:MAG: pyridoxal 5'-phosphate synthase [Bacteroidia bacterium]